MMRDIKDDIMTKVQQLLSEQMKELIMQMKDQLTGIEILSMVL